MLITLWTTHPGLASHPSDTFPLGSALSYMTEPQAFVLASEERSLTQAVPKHLLKQRTLSVTTLRATVPGSVGLVPRNLSLGYRLSLHF